jgi:drug/metabolite transporter (DMT)-like permease
LFAGNNFTMVNNGWIEGRGVLPMSSQRVYLMMVVTALFWSGAFVTGKLAVREFPAFALTFFRFLFALPFIFTILYSRQPQEWVPKREMWRPLLILGILGTFLYHALFFSCLKYTTAINSSLIGSTNPMVTTLLAVLFFGEKMSLIRVCGVFLSFLGVFLTVTNGDWQVVRGVSLNPGDVLMFAAVWSWAAYSVLSRKYMQKYQLSPLMMTAYTFLICTIVSVPFVLWERPLSYLPATTWGGWLAIIYMAVFASVLGYLFQLIAIQKIGAPKAAIFINLVPVFTIFQSVLFLGETVSIFKLLSAGIIITGVYLATRPEKRQEPPIAEMANS